MICPYCQMEMTSEKVFNLHMKKCSKKNLNPSICLELENMNWHELLKYASEQGVNTKGKKKQEILDSLNKEGN